MVLQREPLQAKIWGWAARGANVTVTLDHGQSTVFDLASTDDGSWSIRMPSQPAGAGHVLHISDGKKTIQLDDIAFGDVYLCSGQSNMEMAVYGSFNQTQEIADSVNYPNLRLATVQKTTADEPQSDVGSRAHYIWERSSPESIQTSPPSSFGVYSATCYFFGRDLYKSLNGTVPIGLLTSCWGGQKVEAFSSPDALADDTCGGLHPASTSEQQRPKDVNLSTEGLSEGPMVWEDVEETQLWNAMIHPFLPMQFSGVIWYQGEANAGNPEAYACRFPAMISDWRLKFGHPNLPFFYVELSGPSQPYPKWPFIRAAQRAAMKLPDVGMATAVDLGDKLSPLHAVHPRRKQEVGRRLSQTVRAMHYKDDTGYRGPVVAGVQLKKRSSLHSSITMSFEQGTAHGLHLAGGADCEKCCQEPPFEVLDRNGNWTRALTSRVWDIDHVGLLTNVSDVFGLRYAWEDLPECLLYNGQGGPDDHLGLPAVPFTWCAFPSGKGDWTQESCQLPQSLVNEAYS